MLANPLRVMNLGMKQQHSSSYTWNSLYH